MLVKELIEILSKLPQEATIKVDVEGSTDYQSWEDILEKRIQVQSSYYLGDEKVENVCIDVF